MSIVRKLAFFALSGILLLTAGCGSFTSEPLNATVFSVLDKTERTEFESFYENPPVSMLVRYDQIYPDCTVSDAALINRMYDAIIKIRITAKTDVSKTDGYHRVLFTTADGKSYGLSFEHDLLSVDDTQYELENAEEFFSLLKQIAEDCYENNIPSTNAY